MIGFSAGAMKSLNAALASDPGARPTFFGYICGPMMRIAVPADVRGAGDGWRAARQQGFGMRRPGTTRPSLLTESRLWLETHGWLHG